MAFDYAAHEAQMASEIRQEVADSARTFEVLISNMKTSGIDLEVFERIKRDTNNLSLLCGGIDDRLIDLLMHRFNNYLGYVTEPTNNQLDDFAVFIDMMNGLASGEIEMSADPAEFVRSLPVHRPADLDDVAHLHIEVLVIDSQKTGARFVARELQNCGFRVVTSTRSAEAIHLAVTTRPDLIITSALIDEIGGIELVKMLAIPALTKGIPIALLTSFALEDERLKELPGQVSVLRKGGNFSDDLVKTLEKMGLA